MLGKVNAYCEKIARLLREKRRRRGDEGQVFLFFLFAGFSSPIVANASSLICIRILLI